MAMSLHSDILRILDNDENMSQHSRRSYWTNQIILMVRKDAARDLSVWIHENHPQIKGWSDIPVDEALDIVEGKP
jgi:hypothetical protein